MTASRPDPLVRLAHVVGDFGNPFYAEERQRDVWNEASAFGLQLLLWGVLLAGNVTVWRVGGPAVPYVGGALALVGAVCWLTLAYAARLGVGLIQPIRVLRLRLLPYGLLLLGLVVGMLHGSSTDFWSSFGIGLGTGAAVAVGGLALAARRARRRAAEEA